MTPTDGNEVPTPVIARRQWPHSDGQRADGALRYAPPHRVLTVRADAAGT